MRTVVYQSFRTQDVPPWIALCLESVKRWASLQGFEYRFYDDGFFERVPADLRLRASQHNCVLADYARLIVARDLLKEGWDRAIWVDADAVVFAPRQFTVPVAEGYAFCREVWLDRMSLGKPQFNLTVNNSISVFCRDETIIDFYLNAARVFLKGDEPVFALSIGTDFLLKLRRAHPFRLLTSMGIFGPEMTYRYLQNDGRFLKPYLAFQTSPIYAANLCLSHHSEKYHFDTAKNGWELNERTLLDFIARLQADEGQSLNQWFEASYQATSREFDHPLSSVIGAKRAAKELLRNVRAF